MARERDREYRTPKRQVPDIEERGDRALQSNLELRYFDIGIDHYIRRGFGGD